MFSYGSARIALAIASNTKAISVVGGGDTADFVLKGGMAMAAQVLPMFPPVAVRVWS